VSTSFVTLRRVALAAAIVMIAAGFVLWRRAQVQAKREMETILGREYISYEKGAPRALGPNLAVSRQGGVVVAWMQSDLGVPGDAIGVRFSPDEGEHFGPIQRLRFPGRLVADPAIAALPNGGFVLAGLASASRDVGAAPAASVFAARAEPGGERFADPVLVTPDDRGRAYDRPWLAAVSSGTSLLAYRFSDGPTGGVELATSNDGRAWDRRPIVSAPGFAGGPVTLCAAPSGGNVYLAYVDPERGAVLRASHDGGATFPDEAVRIVSSSEEKVAIELPSCVAVGDEVVVAYGTGPISNDPNASPFLSQVALARSRDGGRTFDARVAVSEPDRVIFHPRIVALERNEIGMVAYTGTPPYGASGDVRFFHPALGVSAEGGVKGTLAPSLILRGHVRISALRSDAAWPGDFLGLAEHRGRTLVAVVDADAARVVSTPQIVFLSGTTPL
jgi:hypothetical protein